MITKGFIVTGRAAHERIARLFTNLVEKNESNDVTWVDLSPYASISSTECIDASMAKDVKVDFIWENSPRHNTKAFRDTVSVYSHLPNGTKLLDDKWVLARLLGSSFVGTDSNSQRQMAEKDTEVNGSLATLESHCFRGSEFVSFANRVGLLAKEVHESNEQYKFEDLIDGMNSTTIAVPSSPTNLWVIKDAMSNGAGGIWMLDPNNIHEFLDSENNTTSPDTSILHPTHRYIAQRYSWPPTLYAGKKCHVRVYGCINSKGEAFVHKRAFLHVANDRFQYNQSTTSDGKFVPSVHITNCCANSHDAGKFAGEICANLSENKTRDGDVPLGIYFPSIAASFAELAKKSAPFLRGGKANNGFEYLGMDFILSSVANPNGCTKRRPVAYLLEVNAPPSQDTATGLEHAEELHDEVISDLLKMCVLPELGVANRDNGGWKCVYQPKLDESSDRKEAVVPSKAAFVNQVLWAMYEKRATKEYEMHWLNATHAKSKCESYVDSFDHDGFVQFIRSQFPYFSTSRDVFFESGGGAQVPQIVIDAVRASLLNRDRSIVGSRSIKDARQTLLSLITGRYINDESRDTKTNMIFMGPNATSLLERLASRFKNLLKEGDEIVLASENHLANVLPWLALAKHVGAQVKWWTVVDTKKDLLSKSISDIVESSVLSDLVNPRTKIVTISHASNILGCVRDIQSICKLVHQKTGNRGHVIVDGVAAAPHMLSSNAFVGDAYMQPDWYVVSLHKFFGPHLGCLIGKKSSVQKILTKQLKSEVDLYKLLEMGTINSEACAGAVKLYNYLKIIGVKSMKLANLEKTNNDALFMQHLQTTIHCVETRLANHLLCALSQSTSLVRIIQDHDHQSIGRYEKSLENSKIMTQLPFISFVHANIAPDQIVTHCRNNSIICRACTFLSTDRFWREMGVCEDGVVRFSLAHYNTIAEIDMAVKVLTTMDGWA